MRAWELQSLGWDGLVLTERPEPQAGPGQVLLRMRAASLNSRDLQIVHGNYGFATRGPIVPVSDGVGEVVAVGDGVTRVEVGDRVSPILFQRWLRGPIAQTDWRHALGAGGRDGVLCELAVFDEEAVVRIPAHLTDEQGATLTVAGLTAWQALFVADHVKAGDTVLVQGTGGVSIFALQLAAAAGARVIVTSSSDEKLARARQLGAWQTINYRSTPEWQEEARRLTGGEGVHHVVEVIGDHPRSIRALRIGGAVSVIGYLADLRLGEERVARHETSIMGLILANGRVLGVADGNRDAYEEMNRAIEACRLEPVVDRTFAFEDAVEAMRYLASGTHFGKVCIRISP